MPARLTSAEPVRKSVTVPAAPERAFGLFTAHIHQWWPLASHSVGGAQAAGIVFGACAGAQITETLADGSTSVWGTVTDWEPPHRVAFTWHAGTAAAEATRVEVTFTSDEPGTTVVRLVHSGWEHRPDGAAARDGYEAGWEPVIASFAATAATGR
ncbi:MAG TPA: SRPBCC domain-containing protein [Streptosporangiaceae bacterium]